MRLFRGAYMDAQEYAALDISGRYRARAQAFLATHAKLRAWGITAAALEGAPVLGGAPLHFGGARSHAKSKQDGCAFHEASLETPSNPVAQTLFECASTSPLPDALLAANYLLRRSSAKAQGGLVACRDIDESTTEALVWEPATSGSGEASSRSAFDIRMLDMEEPEFLANYSAARVTGFVSPEAELLWLAFAQLCFANGRKRGVRSALQAGLYFTDQVESPAESLLIAVAPNLASKFLICRSTFSTLRMGGILVASTGFGPLKPYRRASIEAIAGSGAFSNVGGLETTAPSSSNSTAS